MKIFASVLLFYTFSANLLAFDLHSAVETAFKNDPQFISEEKVFEKQVELVNLARAPLLPNLSITSSYSDITYSGNVDTKTQNIGLSLSQTLFDKTKFVILDQSRLDVQIAELNFKLAQEKTILRIADAYFDILIAQNNLTSIKAEKNAVEEQLEFAKRNFEVGTSTITDQQEAQARFDLIRASEIRTENALAIARTNLTKSLLIPIPETFKGIKGKIIIEKPKYSAPSEWMKIARSKNLQVKIASKKSQRSRLELKKKKAERLPTLNLTLSTGHSKQESLSTLSQDNQIITLNVAAPIFLGGSISASKRQAIADNEREKKNLELALLNADRVAGKSFRTLIAGVSQVEALEAAEASSKVALESNKLGYEVGVRINIDVLNAQRQLFSTQRDLAIARYDVLKSKLQLLSATGSLNINEVKKISNLMLRNN